MAEIIIRGQIAHVANRHRHQRQAATRAQETRPGSAATAAPRTEYDRQAKRKARRVKSAGLRSAPAARSPGRPARSEARFALGRRPTVNPLREQSAQDI